MYLEAVKGEIEFDEGRRVERQLGHRICYNSRAFPLLLLCFKSLRLKNVSVEQREPSFAILLHTYLHICH